MIVPYTTRTGLRIGCMYQPPRQSYMMSREAYRLQEALLLDSLPRRRSKALPVILSIAALAAIAAASFLI